MTSLWSLAAILALAAPAPDFYPLAVGHRWTYEATKNGKPGGTETVTILSLRADGIDRLARARVVRNVPGWLGGVTDETLEEERRVAGRSVVVDRAGWRVELLRLPPRVGERWPVTIQTAGVMAALGPIQATAAVEGVERIDTPAGRWPGCVRVRMTAPTKLGEFTTIRWFGPGVGLVRSEIRHHGDVVVSRLSAFARP